MKKKKWTPKKILTISNLVGMVALMVSGCYFTSCSRFSVDTERVTVPEITKSTPQEFIPVNGIKFFLKGN